MKNWKEINERRDGYRQKLAKENREITTLSEGQHDALEWLCAARHKLHVNQEAMFNAQSGEYDELWNLLNEEINENLREAGLPEIDFSTVDLEFIPSSSDWDLFLTEDERKEWEDKAEIISENMNGYALWLEEGEEYKYFWQEISKVNDIIESYLIKIDKKHGTKYCPSGSQRFE